MAAGRDELLRAMRDGTGAGDEPALRRALGLEENAEDRVVARALVKAVAEAHLAALEVRSGPPPVRESTVAQVSTLVGRGTATGAPPPNDASFLARLGTGASQSDERTGVYALADVRTVLAVMQAGALRQRRAAVRRLVQLVGEQAKERSADDLRAVIAALTTSRDIETGYEVSQAIASLPGPAARKERTDREPFAEAVAAASIAVRHFWEGEDTTDWIGGLASEQRAMLLLRLRDVPDGLVDHLCAVLEGADGAATLDARRTLESALRHA